MVYTQIQVSWYVISSIFVIEIMANRDYERKQMFQHLQIVDPVEIGKMVDKVLSENPKQLEQYRGGKTKLQGFFAGQVR